MHMKNSFLILTILLGTLLAVKTQAQITKMRAKSASFNVFEDGVWSGWSEDKEVNLLIVYNDETLKFDMYMEEPLTFDVYSTSIEEGVTDDEVGFVAYSYKCIDSDGERLEVTVRTFFEDDVFSQFYLRYPAFVISYNVVFI